MTNAYKYYAKQYQPFLETVVLLADLPLSTRKSASLKLKSSLKVLAWLIELSLTKYCVKRDLSKKSLIWFLYCLYLLIK